MNHPRVHAFRERMRRHYMSNARGLPPPGGGGGTPPPPPHSGPAPGAPRNPSGSASNIIFAGFLVFGLLICIGIALVTVNGWWKEVGLFLGIPLVLGVITFFVIHYRRNEQKLRKAKGPDGKQEEKTGQTGTKSKADKKPWIDWESWDRSKWPKPKQQFYGTLKWLLIFGVVWIAWEFVPMRWPWQKHTYPKVSHIPPAVVPKDAKGPGYVAVPTVDPTIPVTRKIWRYTWWANDDSVPKYPDGPKQGTATVKVTAFDYDRDILKFEWHGKTGKFIMDGKLSTGDHRPLGEWYNTHIGDERGWFWVKIHPEETNKRSPSRFIGGYNMGMGPKDKGFYSFELSAVEMAERASAD